jgi:hypothetical protein
MLNNSEMYASIKETYNKIDAKKERVAEIDKKLKNEMNPIGKFLLKSERKVLISNQVELLKQIEQLVMQEG